MNKELKASCFNLTSEDQTGCSQFCNFNQFKPVFCFVNMQRLLPPALLILNKNNPNSSEMVGCVGRLRILTFIVSFISSVTSVSTAMTHWKKKKNIELEKENIYNFFALTFSKTVQILFFFIYVCFLFVQISLSNSILVQHSSI